MYAKVLVDKNTNHVTHSMIRRCACYYPDLHIVRFGRTNVYTLEGPEADVTLFLDRLWFMSSKEEV